MKKVLQITTLLLLIASISFGQTAIPNGSFETWTGTGTASAQPTTWSSNKTGTGYAPSGPQTCFQSDTAHSGNFSALVTSVNYLGIALVNGSLTTGQVCAPTTNKLAGYISSIPGNTGHIATFTGKPDSLIFWYRYYNGSTTDYPTVEARLHIDTAFAPEAPYSNNHAVCTEYIVARALWQGGTGNVHTWTRVSIPFTYAINNVTPQYILITTTSSGLQNGGSAGSTLLLDDFLAYYIPALATGNVTTGPYYVSATGSTTISVPFTLTGTMDSSNVVTAQLSDANGSFATPVTLGTLATLSSGTITGTIPAGTVTGAGYRVRVVSSNRALTAADNGSNITIDLVGNSIAPSTAQTIAANTNGSIIAVTETPAATSRQWEYSTTSGGSYQPFTTTQTGTLYAPNFSTAGTYYVVCVSTYPGNLTATSNQVQVNVVSNSIAPTGTQSILTGVNGTTLTVTESATATSRTWAYSTTTSGPYTPVIPSDVSTTYTPNFASAGTYYVVCQSVINGVTVTSNEVVISVGSATITTQPVTGSPFLFSPAAPNASVTVAYTVSGTFNNGNVFTAQLSDATGSFTSATTIGTTTSTTSGTINATIPSTTAAGTGYRIRVISSNPAINGSDNGTDLLIDQFHNSVAPSTTQTIQFNTNGTPLTVTASQTGNTEWRSSTTSGSGYANFSPAQTGTTYTPNFATPGTYYVVALSYNQYNDSVTSNEVEIIVTNGSTLTTLAVAGSPFLVSVNANVAVSVNYTSDVFFGSGNVFQAQLSDSAGSFASPVTIGSLTRVLSGGTIASVIPNNSLAGTHYRIRVVSSNPALTGSADSTDLTIIPFAVAIDPVTSQTLLTNQTGTVVTASTTQPTGATYNWEVSLVSGTGYLPFTPAQTAATFTPLFDTANTYYVVCNVTNAINDSLLTPEVTFVVTKPVGINRLSQSVLKAYWDDNSFVVDLTGANLKTPVLQLVDVTGRVVLNTAMTAATVNHFGTQLPEGIYVFKIVDGEQLYTGKTAKK